MSWECHCPSLSVLHASVQQFNVEFAQRLAVYVWQNGGQARNLDALIKADNRQKFAKNYKN